MNVDGRRIGRLRIGATLVLGWAAVLPFVALAWYLLSAVTWRRADGGGMNAEPAR